MYDAKLQAAKNRLKSNPDITSIGEGFKYRNGRRTQETALVVCVKMKIHSPKEIPDDRFIPRTVFDYHTDVREFDPFVGPLDQALDYDGKMRPAPPGVSIGHPDITAGTLGEYVLLSGFDNEYFILSNNHVLANVNGGVIGDFIRQPGRYDGGTQSDRIARLHEYVYINFENKKKDNKATRAYWRLGSAPANLGAAATKLLPGVETCPYRLRATVPHRVEQPYPNLVDCAVARMINQSWVERDHVSPAIKITKGFRDFQLAHECHKNGRTTEYRRGTVDVVNVWSRIDFGSPNGVTEFDDQIQISGQDGEEFSAPGDSGSSIISMDGYFGALLFAGSKDYTLANRVGNIVALLGIRL